METRMSETSFRRTRTLPEPTHAHADQTFVARVSSKSAAEAVERAASPAAQQHLYTFDAGRPASCVVEDI